MLRKLLSLASATALIAGVESVSAQNFSGTEATASWAVGNESEATINSEAADAFWITKVTVGTDLSVTSTTATYNLAAEGTVGPYATYQPGTSNAGCVAADMVEYTVETKNGISFTLTSVSFDLIKVSTDNAYISWSYTVDGVESDIVGYSNPKTQIRRNNDANPSAPLTHLEQISGASAGKKVTLRLYVSNVANDKKMSMGNIKICGTVSGTATGGDTTPQRTVSYFGLDGKTLVGTEEVEDGTALSYKYGEADLTNLPADHAFRGWFNSTLPSALKVPEGTPVQENLSLYAKATAIEQPTVGSIFRFALNSPAFYPEDHECFATTGKFHDTQHGFVFNAGQSLSLKVAGNAVITLGGCSYSNTACQVTMTNGTGNAVGKPQNAYVATDGANISLTYQGEATTLTLTFSATAYVHNVIVYNVESVPTKNAFGYYEIAPGDGASLLLVLAALQEGDKIFLPNGTYDFGEKALTAISANNVSIIGESMEGTIIRNAPDKSTEGISTTATLLNTSNNLYLQDLTIQNALDYYATGSAGRAVCLQDKGTNTICKNVRMLSYQDTYYSNKASRFYWEDSEIHGTVDYLCGDGDVVYNRCKFVNESRARDSKSGSDVLCAPNHSASCTWGYVFLDCTIESRCKDFTLARSWGGKSAAQFIRTKVLDNSLAASRWTIAGMNVAAYKFKEFGTTDKDGNVTTPASNVVTFTHSSGNLTYETVLSADEAAAYTVANIYGEWAPDQVAAQVTSAEQVGENAIYLVNGQITGQRPASGLVRVANARGGFGPAFNVTTNTISLPNASLSLNDGKQLRDGHLVIIRNGQTFSPIGQMVK